MNTKEIRVNREQLEAILQQGLRKMSKDQKDFALVHTGQYQESRDESQTPRIGLLESIINEGDRSWRDFVEEVNDQILKMQESITEIRSLATGAIMTVVAIDEEAQPVIDFLDDTDRLAELIEDTLDRAADSVPQNPK